MTPAKPKSGAYAPTIVQKLPGGLTLLLRENHDVPVATADVWVGTGAAGETAEVGGISHFLEHMLFKGTENFGLGQIEREIENVGGVSNAATSYDYTHYYLTLPSEGLARGIEMLAEMVISSTLDETELEKERLVILEEYRRKQDDPEALLYEDLYEQLHETGPYHRSVIGEEATIRSISRPQMLDYYHRHYAPPNMALVLTGDFDAEAAARLAEKTFGADPRPFNPLLAEPEPTTHAHAKRHHRTKPTGGEVYFSLTCAAPDFSSTEDMMALDMAQYILGQGRASTLYQEIKEKRRLATTVECYYSAQRHTGMFMLDATCEPEKRRPLREALDETIDRFANEPITDEQFTRARRLLASGHLFSFETTGATSVQVGYYYTLTGSVEFLDRYMERLDALTPGEVQAAFRKMIDKSEWIEVSVGPESNGQ